MQSGLVLRFNGLHGVLTQSNRTAGAGRVPARLMITEIRALRVRARLLM